MNVDIAFSVLYIINILFSRKQKQEEEKTADLLAESNKRVASLEAELADAEYLLWSTQEQARSFMDEIKYAQIKKKQKTKNKKKKKTKQNNNKPKQDKKKENLTKLKFYTTFCHGNLLRFYYFLCIVLNYFILFSEQDQGWQITNFGRPRGKYSRGKRVAARELERDAGSERE